MCGLPAAGKTTAAARLHARAGGTLIRSCDVFAALGISVAAWVERTRGFAVGACDYEALRDGAYVEMGRRLEAALEARSGPVLVDAAHVERAKRRAVYDICRRHGARPAIVWCRCDDGAEIARRLARRLAQRFPCGRSRTISITSAGQNARSGSVAKPRPRLTTSNAPPGSW